MYVVRRLFDVFALYSREKIKYRMSKWCPAYSFIFHQGLTIKMFPFQKKKGKEAMKTRTENAQETEEWKTKNGMPKAPGNHKYSTLEAKIGKNPVLVRELNLKGDRRDITFSPIGKG